MLIIHFRIASSCDVKGNVNMQINCIYFFLGIFWLSERMDVSHEVELLVGEIKRLGTKSKFISWFCAVPCLQEFVFALAVYFMPQILPRLLKIKKDFHLFALPHPAACIHTNKSMVSSEEH